MSYDADAMNDEAALLRAITANAGDDTPRLVYADWLDENEGPLQAEFIRVQCRLAQATAADRDYCDLLERHSELRVLFRPMARVTVPELPPGFVCPRDPLGRPDGFRRGFLYTVSGQWSESLFSYTARAPTEDELDRASDGLAPLVAGTTARALALDAMTPGALARVLAAPGADALTGLTLSSGGGDSADGDALTRALAAARSAGNLEHLTLNMSATAAGVGALGANFNRLRSLEVSALGGAQDDLARITTAPWFAGLRRVRAGT
ncbi:MAG: TIGR02996 domain-containing protein, partial [Gemmata sp.]